jgi:hypothetical protein
MKRWLIGLVAALAVLFLLYMVVPAEARTAAWREVAQTFTALQTFGAGAKIGDSQDLTLGTGAQIASSGTEEVTVRNTDTSAAVAILADPATPAIGDSSSVRFETKESDGAVTTTGLIDAVSTDITPGASSGYLGFQTRKAGVQTEWLKIDEDGKFIFGGDTNLYRLSPDILGSDDAFAATSLLAISGDVESAAGNVNVTGGQKVNFAGSSGDTYLARTISTGSLDLYTNGSLAGQMRADHLILGDCPSDLSTLEFGSLCKDITTGTIKYRGTLEAVP